MALDSAVFRHAKESALGLPEGGIDPQLLDALVAQNSDGRIVVPGSELLPRADFVREGSDLLLTAPGGDSHLIVNYFALPSPPDLVTEGGAIIRGDLATRLAGPLAPRQYAQVEGIADDASGSIGKVDNLVGHVPITRADGAKVTAAKDTAIFQDDVIETAADGNLGIVFTDNTTFSLGGDGRMVIDAMIYDAAANTGSSAGNQHLLSLHLVGFTHVYLFSVGENAVQKRLQFGPALSIRFGVVGEENELLADRSGSGIGEGMHRPG